MVGEPAHGGLRTDHERGWKGIAHPGGRGVGRVDDRLARTTRRHRHDAVRSRASGRIIECSGEGPLCYLLAAGLGMGLEPDIGQQLTQAV
jgi:hypothetical protein